jgi:hypothetical protein
MKMRTQYSYSIIKYVHDTATSEFVNVGVGVFSQVDGFFKVMCRSTLGRVSDVFPDIKGSTFKSLMRETSKRFNEITNAYQSALRFDDGPMTINLLMSSVLPRDDSALVWSEPLNGVTSDPEKTLADLYQRYVSKYDEASFKHKRTDDDVWRSFHKGLENRNISSFFTEKTIEGKIDEVKFKSAWKNGVWHCVEPISFDLAAADGIKDKALRFLGQISSVEDSNEPFKIYLVLGKPTDKELHVAFEKAVAILGKIPVDYEIFTEDQENLLLDELSLKIKNHNPKLQLTNPLQLN